MPTINVRWADNTAQLKNNLKEGVSQIEATKSSVERLVKALAGDNLIAAAHKWTAAISEMGGVSKIASADAVRAFGTIQKAIETLERQGKVVPQAMRDLSKELEAAIPHASALNKWFGSLGTQVVATAAGFISAQAVIGTVSSAFHTMTAFVADSVKAYASAESAQVKMTAALKSQSMATPEVIKQYNDLASEFQRTTVFSDDLINSMEALLVQVGGVMPGQMKQALQASTDLAAGLGIDLETATMLVAKAAAGHTETLGRYGISVSEADLKTRGFTAVLEAVNKQFGGQANSQLDTYAGKVQQIANAWDNVKEAIGKAIVDDPLIEAGLIKIAQGADSAQTATFSLSNGMRTLLSNFESMAAFVPGIGTQLQGLTAEFDALHDAAIQFDVFTRAMASTKRAVDTYKATIGDHTAQDILARGLAESARLTAEDAQKKKDDAAAAKALNAELKRLADEALAKLNARLKEIDPGTVTFKVVALMDSIKALDAEPVFVPLLEAIKALRTEGIPTAEAMADAVRRGPLAAFGALADKLREIERTPYTEQFGNRGLAGDLTNVGIPTDDIEKLKEKLKEAKSGVADLAQAFGTLAQISGGSFGGAVKAIGQVIGVINVAETAMKDLDKAVDAGTAKWGDYAKAGVGAFSVLMAGYSALFSYINSANAKDQAKFNALMNASADFAKRADQFRLTVSVDEWAELTAKLKELFSMDPKNTNGIRELSAEIEGLISHYEKLAGIASSKYGMNANELKAAAQDAHDTFDFMLKSGLYTQTQLDAAYLDFQKALAATGDAAAAAWLKAHGEIDDTAKAAHAALDALTSKRDSIASSYANEAPEEVMGSIEAAARAQVAALDQQIAAEQARVDAAAEAAAAVITDTVGGAAEETKKHLHDGIVDGLSGAGAAAEGAKSDVASVFADFKIAIPFSFYQEGPGPGGSGAIAGAGSGAGAESGAGSGVGSGLVWNEGMWVPDNRPIHAATGGTVRSWGLEPFSIDSLAGPRGADRYPLWVSEGETVRTPQQEAALQAGGASEDGGMSVIELHNYMELDGAVVGHNVVNYQIKHDKRGLQTSLKKHLGLPR